MIVRLCPIVCVSVNVRCMIDGHASHKGNPWPMGVHGFITIPFHGKTTHVWPLHTCSLQSYVPIQNIDCPILHVHVLIWSHLRISSHILMFLDHDWFFLYLLILSQENHQTSPSYCTPWNPAHLASHRLRLLVGGLIANCIQSILGLVRRTSVQHDLGSIYIYSSMGFRGHHLAWI